MNNTNNSYGVLNKSIHKNFVANKRYTLFNCCCSVDYNILLNKNSSKYKTKIFTIK